MANPNPTSKTMLKEASIGKSLTCLSNLNEDLKEKRGEGDMSNLRRELQRKVHLYMVVKEMQENN